MEGSGIPAARSLALAGLPVWRAREDRHGPWLVAMLSLLLVVLPARPQIGGLDFARMQSAAGKLGPRAERAAGEVRDLVLRVAAIDDALRLQRVNDHVNRRIAFAPDTLAWNQEDHWATPLEALAKGEGDCEDYAIAKYFLLLAAGTPAVRLRLVYVRAELAPTPAQPGGTQAHMVLAYYADNGAEPLILDNLVADIHPASRRPDLTPVFSFNADGLWSGAGSQPAGNPLARLSRWRDVLQRARAEGFE